MYYSDKIIVTKYLIIQCIITENHQWGSVACRDPESFAWVGPVLVFLRKPIIQLKVGHCRPASENVPIRQKTFDSFRTRTRVVMS